MLTDDGRTTDGRTDNGRTTDAGVTGILIAHLGAFCSGELTNRTSKIESQHEISNNVICGTSKGSDQPAHMHNLISFVCFVALRPKSTAMVMAGQSVHLTTLFSGQA